MRKLWMMVTIAGLLSSTPAWGDSLPSTVRALLQEYWRTKDSSLLPQVTQTDSVSAYIFDRFVEEQMPQRIAIKAFRQDLLLGSFSPTSGSTSVVARPGATDLISAAIESGAVTRKTDDTAVTFTLNALPIYQLMNGKKPVGCGSLEEDCRRGVGLRIRGLSGSVSINTSDPTTPFPASLFPVLAGVSNIAGFLTGANKLLDLSARYEFFVRERNPEQAQARLDEAAKALTDKVASFLESQADFETRLQMVLGEPDKPGWTRETQDALKRNTDSIERMAEVLLTRYRLAYDLAAGSTALQGIQAAVLQEKLSYIAAQNKVLAEKLYRKAFTLDYVNQRPSDQPRLHQLRLVVATPIGRKPPDTRLADSRNAAVPSLNLTLNGGVSFFHGLKTAANPGRVRDAQTSLALDWSPAGWGSVRPTYTAAYYFQYMVENGIIQFNQEAVTPGGSAIAISGPAVEVLNTKGPIHVGQFRLSIPIGNSGISFPAAVSYSSRTELITGRSFWQGHIGVTYDLSRLTTFLQSSQPQ
ncbi:MAG TPA: hypothetical protein VE422_06970 [Terriglobia bacterium]|nr:hypothetical protein [Terriglobia bacterium]